MCDNTHLHLISLIPTNQLYYCTHHIISFQLTFLLTLFVPFRHPTCLNICILFSPLIGLCTIKTQLRQLKFKVVVPKKDKIL